MSNLGINNLVVSNTTTNEEFTASYDNTPPVSETALAVSPETIADTSLEAAVTDAVNEIEEATAESDIESSVNSSSDEKGQEAMKVHDAIVNTSKAVTYNSKQLGILLKQMRDDKLYKRFGCKTFEQYCEEKAGISYRHAHRYIFMVENISPENLTTLSGLSVSKLMKIATLTPDEQNDLIANNDLNSMSVRKLDAMIKEMHTKKVDSNSDDRTFVNELRDLPKRLKALSGRLKSNEFDNNDSITKCINTIAEAVAELEKLMQADSSNAEGGVSNE